MKREEAVRAADELGKQFVFFTQLLSKMRDMVVATNTKADQDKRHFLPKFKEALQLIQDRAKDYNEQIGAFQALVASRSRS